MTRKHYMLLSRLLTLGGLALCITGSRTSEGLVKDLCVYAGLGLIACYFVVYIVFEESTQKR